MRIRIPHIEEILPYSTIPIPFPDTVSAEYIPAFLLRYEKTPLIGRLSRHAQFPIRERIVLHDVIPREIGNRQYRRGAPESERDDEMIEDILHHIPRPSERRIPSRREMKKDEIMNGHHECSRVEYRNIEMREMDEVETVFPQTIREEELLPPSVPGIVGERFPKSRIARRILVEILPPQKNDILIVRIDILQMRDQSFRIPTQSLPDRSVESGVDTYAQSHIFVQDFFLILFPRLTRQKRNNASEARILNIS
jgi:hypothetical protein